MKQPILQTQQDGRTVFVTKYHQRGEQVISAGDRYEFDVTRSVSRVDSDTIQGLTESLIDAAMTLGLDDQSARHLVLQTALGTAKMAKGNAASPQELRVQVTSPGGTTQAACTVLKDQQLPAIIVKAVTAAQRRSIELGKG